jgi:Cu/Ag efflux pump CusA
MCRIAVPRVGGMITAPLVSMVLIPVFYLLWQTHRTETSRRHARPGIDGPGRGDYA